MTAGRPSKYDPKFCQKIIEVGEAGGSKTEMASACGVLLETMNSWVDVHEAFANAMKIAVQASQTWWEEKGRQATFGGQPGFNATSFIFQMKNRFGHDYQDVHKVDAQQTINHNHTLKIDQLSAEQLESLALMLAPKADDSLLIEYEE